MKDEVAGEGARTEIAYSERSDWGAQPEKKGSAQDLMKRKNEDTIKRNLMTLKGGRSLTKERVNLGIGSLKGNAGSFYNSIPREVLEKNCSKRSSQK